MSINKIIPDIKQEMPEYRFGHFLFLVESYNYFLSIFSISLALLSIINPLGNFI